MADERNRKEIADRTPKSLDELIKVLDNCIMVRTVGRDIDIALKNYIPGDVHHKVLAEIYHRYENVVVASTTAFRYGVMVGKRAERARRKGGMVA